MDGGESGQEHRWLPFLLQATDPLFPTGAYAHSFGLEGAVQLGWVKDEASLSDFLTSQVLPTLQRLELPMIRFAFLHAEEGSVSALVRDDLEAHRRKLSREAREASILLGRRRLATAGQVSPRPVLAAFAACVDSGKARGHHPVVFALQCACIGVPLSAALAAAFYQAVAAHCSAALKLIRIGQAGSQRVLTHCMRHGSDVIRASMDEDDLSSFQPLLDIASMRHQFASERLFIS